VITFLVRHADAGDKRSWDGPDEERPPVTRRVPPSRGARDAHGGLSGRSDSVQPDRAMPADLQPLARDRLLPIEPVAALSVDGGLTEILQLFWDRRLRNAVLGTHGESISRLFVQLAARGLVTSEPLHWPKGSTWLLHRTDRRGVHARYLSPLALDDSVHSG
jgi:hypothetical protein